VVPSQGVLVVGANTGIDRGKEAAGRRARGEELGRGQTLEHGHKVGHEGVLVCERGQLVEGLDRLLHNLPSTKRRPPRTKNTHLLAHDRLLLGCEVLEGGQQHGDVLGSTNQLGELAQLVRESEQNLVLVVNRLCTPPKKKKFHELRPTHGDAPTAEEGDQLETRSLGAEGEGNRAQTTDGVETKGDVLFFFRVVRIKGNKKQ